MVTHANPKRVWFDLNIGTDPSMALGLLFACKHPEIEVVGISVSGKNQEKRVEEAYKVLEYGNAPDVDVYYGEDITRETIDAAQPTDTIVRGPLTNIAKLVLDEATLGRIHFVGGAFRTVYYRGMPITTEQYANSDLGSTRIVLTQYEDIVISSFEAASALMVPHQVLDELARDHPFLKARFAGFQEHLREKHGEGFDYIIAADVLAVCDVLEVPTITREVVEFKMQADGSFLSTTLLENNPEPIQENNTNPEKLPVPTIKHEVIRTVNAMRIIQELTKFV